MNRSFHFVPISWHATRFKSNVFESSRIYYFTRKTSDYLWADESIFRSNTCRKRRQKAVRNREEKYRSPTIVRDDQREQIKKINYLAVKFPQSANSAPTLMR